MFDELIHFYRIGRKPFRSLSGLPDAEAYQHMRDLYVEGAALWDRFKDPVWYLEARRQTEQWLREAFIAKGGRPLDACPIYMVWGKTKWLRDMETEAIRATTAEIRVPLSLFDESEISFTYPDSMVTSFLAHEKNPAYYLPEYHGKVFTLSEMREIIAANGLPGEGWGESLPPSLANYVEAQVWNHQRLLEYAQEHQDG